MRAPFPFRREKTPGSFVSISQEWRAQERRHHPQREKPVFSLYSLLLQVGSRKKGFTGAIARKAPRGWSWTGERHEGNHDAPRSGHRRERRDDFVTDSGECSSRSQDPCQHWSNPVLPEPHNAQTAGVPGSLEMGTGSLQATRRVSGLAAVARHPKKSRRFLLSRRDEAHRVLSE